MSKLSYLYGAIAMASLLASAGAVDSDMPITAIVFMILFPVFVCLSMKEDGELRKKGSDMFDFGK